MNINIDNLEKLLLEKKYDEVRALIREVVAQKMSDEEVGAVLTGFVMAYVEISNAINERYRNALSEAVAGMIEINKEENALLDKEKLAEIRKKLNLPDDKN